MGFLKTFLLSFVVGMYLFITFVRLQLQNIMENLQGVVLQK